MYDPDYTKRGDVPARPSRRGVLIAVTCFVVIGVAIYFVAMDRSDRASAQRREADCARDRSYVSSMEAVGSNDITVSDARQRLRAC